MHGKRYLKKELKHGKIFKNYSAIKRGCFKCLEGFLKFFQEIC